MSNGDSTITVTAGADRPSRADQLARLCQRAKDKPDVLRVRLPFMIYDYGEGSGGGEHIHIRDTAWNLRLPPTTTPDQVEALIAAIGTFLQVGAVEGWESVTKRLEGVVG